ncbi:MspA family porin [[Mycobacterium] vasticus]|uniref:MspA family porin n=1 Tax=[Mycobacterium] vasticus TaxID=2875777 RepID=A0ABU5Z0Z9_9MYCO|nr:MspA family porin [Mycolicibacter sp. MYC017]MEB3070820.1 MspA family porin [Mycolicibacter sp. MYC017]
MLSATSVLRRVVVLACVGCLVAPSTGAEPAPDAAPVAAQVPPKEAATVRTPDGWTLTVGTKDESQVPVPPLTTAISSREYVSSGTYFAELIGPEGATPEGVLEAGFQIGCGIDMSTANGVTMSGSAGMVPGLGAQLPVPPGPGAPLQLLPAMATPITGVVTVGLKPGLVFIVPVHQKEFRGAHPWVMISEFHVKIDGCVGQSFIRSYAVLTRVTDESDVVLSYVGATVTV